MAAATDIRRVRPDHPQVVALLAALDQYLASLYPPDANYIVDVQALLAPEVDFVAAWRGDAVVACGAVRRMAGEADTGGQPYGELKRMVTAPDYRGQGIAERIITTLEGGLQAHGVTLVLLETGADQHAAVRLYERCGFRQRGPFGGYPDNGLSLFYEKRLLS